jgi:hypothetical protein
LKKRRSGIYRAVPVPHPLVDMLDLVHGLRPLQVRTDRGRSHRLWPWSRMTGWRRVCEVMAQAGADRKNKRTLCAALLRCLRALHYTPSGVSAGRSTWGRRTWSSPRRIGHECLLQRRLLEAHVAAEGDRTLGSCIAAW